MIRAFAFTLLLAAGTGAAALAEAPIRFEHLTINDGLPENSVRSIVQDRNGFLWFGTQNGVARYDGAAWSRYLPGMCVSAIDLDAEANAWVQASTTTPGETVIDDSVEPQVTYRPLEPGPLGLYVITPETPSLAD